MKRANVVRAFFMRCRASDTSHKDTENNSTSVSNKVIFFRKITCSPYNLTKDCRNIKKNFVVSNIFFNFAAMILKITWNDDSISRVPVTTPDLNSLYSDFLFGKIYLCEMINEKGEIIASIGRRLPTSKS